MLFLFLLVLNDSLYLFVLLEEGRGTTSLAFLLHYGGDIGSIDVITCSGSGLLFK